MSAKQRVWNYGLRTDSEMMSAERASAVKIGFGTLSAAFLSQCASKSARRARFPQPVLYMRLDLIDL